jgi:hypothetical protein
MNLFLEFLKAFPEVLLILAFCCGDGWLEMSEIERRFAGHVGARPFSVVTFALAGGHGVIRVDECGSGFPPSGCRYEIGWKEITGASLSCDFSGLLPRRGFVATVFQRWW